MASTARIDELKKKFDENPRRYFAPLANEFRKSGEIEQAIMICEEFLPQQPGHMSGHIVYGQALYEASRFEESRTVFETALTLDPENLIALRHLGDIARGQGDMDSARRWYDRVLDADPRNEEIQALIALIDPDGASGESRTGPSETTSDASTSAFAWDAPPTMPPPLPTTAAFESPVPHASFAPDHPTLVPPAMPAPVASDKAEGLESVEFAPLAGPVDRAHDLGSSLEPGEFTSPASAVEPLAGLEETSMGAFERNTPDGGPELVMLDTSEPTPSRHLSDAGGSPVSSAPEFERADDPDLAARGMIAPELADRLRGEPPELPSASDESSRIPPELPPSVIAAEAELTDLTDALADSPPQPELDEWAVAPAETVQAARPEAGPEAWKDALPDSWSARDTVTDAAPAPPPTPFVTETMAELFLRQGHRDQALAVYRQLLSASPDDERLAARVAELQPTAPSPAGQSVREFLARFAARRPGERAAAATPPLDDDFAMPAPASAPPRLTPTSVMSTGIERGAATQGGGGSIDALFGNRAAGTSEDSAASALAQAFGGGMESAPAISGRPARAAAGELSLDSVFRGGSPRPPRASQNFSFDEFFAPDSSAKDQPAAASSPTAPAIADPSVPTEPAERNADDIEQFNSWLQGLKPK